MGKTSEKIIISNENNHRIINVSGHNVTLVFKKEKCDAIHQAKKMLSNSYASSLFVVRS